MSDLVEKQVRLTLERQTAALGREIIAKLPAGVGFMFVTADFGEPDALRNMAYVSSVDRRDMIALLRELAAKLEADG